MTINKQQIRKYINILSYYILLLFGLIGTSWIIWSRFVRQRTIRDIPDALLTEYRFWILIYICFIYLYFIKSFWKPNISLIIKEIATHFFSEIIYKPLKTLDQFIKYNCKIEPYYYEFSLKLVKKLITLTATQKNIIIIFLQIIPRSILVIFLVVDTFCYNKLEIFYKIVLIGILPFIFRYIKYSFKDIIDHMIEKLNNYYSFIYIFEEGYDYVRNRIHETKAIHHYKRATIREYLEIKCKNELDVINNEVNYTYIAKPYPKEVLIKELFPEKNIIEITSDDYEELTEPFENLMPIIINLQHTLDEFHTISEKSHIKVTKTIIYSLYFICWSYILIISYYNYPITLTMFNYLINNIQLYLTIAENPFIDDMFSQNTNMITPESIYTLIKMIIRIIIAKILE